MVAGSADMAIAYEASFGELPADPTWEEWFNDPDDPNPQFSNNLTPRDTPNSTKPDSNDEGNAAGTTTLGGQITGDRPFEFIFGDDSGSPFIMPEEGTEWPSVTVYLSANLPGISTDRFLQGVFPTSATINYDQGEQLTMSIECEYATEDTTIAAPASIDRVEDNCGFMWHSLNDPTRNGSIIDDVQSLSVSINQIARGRRNQSRFYTGAFANNHRYEASINAVYQDEEPFQLAYGAAGATEPESGCLDEQDVVLPFVNATGETHEWTVVDAQTDSYSWSELFAGDDLNDPTELNGTDVTVDVTGGA